MKPVAYAALAMAVLLLAGCVGYFHIGGAGTRPEQVEIRYRTPPQPAVKCPPYQPPADEQWPAYPQFGGGESDDEIIDALGHELVTLHERHRAYVQKNEQSYREYVQRCMTQ